MFRGLMYLGLVVLLAAVAASTANPSPPARPQFNPLINVGQSPSGDDAVYDVTGLGFEPGAFVTIDPPVQGALGIWTYADAAGKIDVVGRYTRVPGAPVSFQATEYRTSPPPGGPIFLAKSNIVKLISP